MANTFSWPWLAFAALGFGLFAQTSLEPPHRNLVVGVSFYAVAVLCLILAERKQHWTLPEIPVRPGRSRPAPINTSLLFAAFVFVATASFTFAGNLFTPINVTLWLTAITLSVLAFWTPSGIRLKDRWSALTGWWQEAQHSPVTPAIWLLLAVALVAFFRLYRLEQVPPEMFSDHAEKLIDVQGVLRGETHIFFPRNTGREALQMYVAAATAKLLGTGLSFTTLKLGTVAAGLLTLPFVYLLGVELANRRVGMLAFVLAGVAYWPNVTARVALRFAFYPLFTASTLYFLVKGLRSGRRNDFVLAGLSLGLGLYGYTPFRVVPLVVLVAFGLVLLHRRSRAALPQALPSLGVLTWMAFVVAVPLLCFAVENPQIFFYRSLTRLTGLERPLPDALWGVLGENLWRGLTMFGWDDGEVWPVSVTHRPALDIVSAGLFHLGAVLLLARYVRRRRWQDLFLLVSVPLLLMPSILSLAFPRENPCLNRPAGVIVPVFLIVAMALEGLLERVRSGIGGRSGVRISTAMLALLLLWSSAQNYDLVFNQYSTQYRRSIWNTSELGAVIADFAHSVGTPDSAWVIPYPHWVDTRLVGIEAGYPVKDYALPPEQLADTRRVAGPKLFLVNPNDDDGLAQLQASYPTGSLRRYESKYERDFWVYRVASISTDR